MSALIPFSPAVVWEEGWVSSEAKEKGDGGLYDAQEAVVECRQPVALLKWYPGKRLYRMLCPLPA